MDPGIASIVALIGPAVTITVAIMVTFSNSERSSEASRMETIAERSIPEEDTDKSGKVWSRGFVQEGIAGSRRATLAILLIGVVAAFSFGGGVIEIIFTGAKSLIAGATAAGVVGAISFVGLLLAEKVRS